MKEIHRWPVNSTHKGPVTRKMLPFDDVIIRFFSCVLFTSRIYVWYFPSVLVVFTYMCSRAHVSRCVATLCRFHHCFDNFCWQKIVSVFGFKKIRLTRRRKEMALVAPAWSEGRSVHEYFRCTWFRIELSRWRSRVVQIVVIGLWGIYPSHVYTLYFGFVFLDTRCSFVLRRWGTL